MQEDGAILDEEADARARASAASLWHAWLRGRPLDELPEAIRPRNDGEGWLAQGALAQLAGPHVGWKLAATTEAGRRHIQVEAALPGRLFARFVRDPGSRVPCANVLAVAEAELAFRIGRDLAGPGPFGEADVLDAVEAMLLAIELPDTRLRRFASVGAPQLLADAACAGLFVPGPEVDGWRELDLAQLEATITVNGEEAARGRGENVMGDPRSALAWAANELARLGTPLRAGELVTTGTITVPVPTTPGDCLEAAFGELGRVCVTLA